MAELLDQPRCSLECLRRAQERTRSELLFCTITANGSLCCNRTRPLLEARSFCSERSYCALLPERLFCWSVPLLRELLLAKVLLEPLRREPQLSERTFTQSLYAEPHNTERPLSAKQALLRIGKE